MTLPNTNPALPDAPNPYFLDNSFVRGDQQRANNGFIWDNLEDLDGRVTDLENTNSNLRGYINGGIKYSDANNPPMVLSGVYEVNGKLIYLNSNVSVALSDVIGQGNQALWQSTQNILLMNDEGQCKWMIYGEGLVASGTVGSITGAGTTKTMTTLVGSTGSNITKVLVIYGNDGYEIGSYIITNSNGSTELEFEGPAGLTGGASGNWVIYDKINTLHGAGTSTPVNSSQATKYTPSYGENGWEPGIVSFDTNKNGFYLTIPGYTGWRVIGNFRSDSGAFISRDVISHKSGRNKNDNIAMYQLESGNSSTNTAILYFSTIIQNFGNDYLVINSSTIGFSIKILVNELYSYASILRRIESVDASNVGISLNSNQLSTAITSITEFNRLAVEGNASSSSEVRTASTSKKLFIDDILRAHSDGGAISVLPADTIFNFTGYK